MRTLDLRQHDGVRTRATTTHAYYADGRRENRVEHREAELNGDGAFLPVGKVTWVWTYEGAAVASGASVEVEGEQGLVRRIEQIYVYDGSGRLAQVLEEADDVPLDGIPDARGTEERFYDGTGRLTMRVREVDHDLDGEKDGTWTETLTYEGDELRHRRRAVTAEDYRPLVSDELPETHRVTVLPTWASSGVLLRETLEVDLDLDGLPDAFGETEHVYEPDCP